MSAQVPTLWIPVSSSSGATFEFVLSSVDEELYVYLQMQLVLKAGPGDTDRRCMLLKNRRYDAVYHNNDGGAGFLEWSVTELADGAATTRHQVNNRHLEGPQVLYMPFGLRAVLES